MYVHYKARHKEYCYSTTSPQIRRHSDIAPALLNYRKYYINADAYRCNNVFLRRR